MNLKDYLNQYFEKFGDIFPMYPLAYSATESELIEMIKKCLDSGKDVYEIGIIKDIEQW